MVICHTVTPGGNLSSVLANVSVWRSLYLTDDKLMCRQCLGCGRATKRNDKCVCSLLFSRYINVSVKQDFKPCKTERTLQRIELCDRYSAPSPELFSGPLALSFPERKIEFSSRKIYTVWSLTLGKETKKQIPILYI